MPWHWTPLRLFTFPLLFPTLYFHAPTNRKQAICQTHRSLVEELLMAFTSRQALLFWRPRPQPCSVVGWEDRICLAKEERFSMAAYVGGSSFAANLPRYAEQISIQFTFILNFIKVHLDVSIFLSIILLGYYIINQIRSSVNNNQSKNRLRNS